MRATTYDDCYRSLQQAKLTILFASAGIGIAIVIHLLTGYLPALVVLVGACTTIMFIAAAHAISIPFPEPKKTPPDLAPLLLEALADVSGEQVKVLTTLLNRIVRFENYEEYLPLLQKLSPAQRSLLYEIALRQSRNLDVKGAGNNTTVDRLNIIAGSILAA